jgi:hypothetical protein
MPSEWLSIQETSPEVNAPVRSIQRYLQEFAPWIRAKREGKKLFVHREGIAVLRQIRQLSVERGLSVEEIRGELQTQGMTVTVDVSETQRAIVPVGRVMVELVKANMGIKGDLEKLANLVRTQSEEIAALRQEIRSSKKPWWRLW